MRKRRILSLLLAVAVTATMLIAVPLTASAAEETGYAEWTIYGNSNITAEQPYNEKKSSSDNDITPDIQVSGPFGSKSSFKSTDKDVTLTKYSDGSIVDFKSMTINKSLKLQQGTYVKIDTKLSDSTKFNKYDLTIAYGASTSGKGIKVTGTGSGTTDIKDSSAVNANEVVVKEYTGLRDDTITIERDGSESWLLYVGIKYGYDATYTEDVTSVDIVQENETVYVDSTIDLKVTVLPDNAKNRGITWSAEPSDKVKIDADGTLHGLDACDAVTVKATSKSNPEKSDTCTVVVKKKPEVPGQELTDVNDLAPAENTTYDLLNAAISVGVEDNMSIYFKKHSYFNNHVAVLGTDDMVYNGSKKSMSLSGSENKGSIKVSQGKNVIALKLPNKATIKLNVHAWGSSPVTGYIASSLDKCTKNVPESEFNLATTPLLSTTGTAAGLLEYTNETGDNQIVYISGTGDLGIYDINVTLDGQSVFGKGAADTGMYKTEGAAELGVIRFLQQYTSDTAVTKYGFKIINSETGDIVNQGVDVSASKNPEAVVKNGFYADVYGIKKGEESDVKYYAKAYVMTDDKTIFWSDGKIDGKIDWDNVKEVEKDTSYVN